MQFRVIIAAALLIALLLTVLVLLLATDTALSVWSRLQEAPLWIQVAYGLVVALVSMGTMVLLWRVLRPTRKEKKAGSTVEPLELDESSLEQEILEAANSGIDIEDELLELREKRARASGGRIYVAVCGEVSAGKSSLVSAILPDAQIETDPRAGTTEDVTRYRWQAPGGDQVIIADLPGFNIDENTEAREECLRAHLVVFLCDGDLTASQAAQLKELQRFEKPVLLALNKSDRFSDDELEMILERLRSTSGLPVEHVVSIISGGMVTDSDLEEARTPRIEPLLQAMQAHLDQDAGLMESLRETSVLLLANEKLQAARKRHQDEQADGLVQRYSRRAVVGALAAVAPGSDLIIQGVLATQLLKELAALYGVQVKDLQIDSFLQLAEGKVKNMSAITLAIAGNALKAFPGLGTLTGGLVHAVAYGMIFDSLGKAAAKSLASRGELRPIPAARDFEELMNENLESGVVRFARLALEHKKDRKD
jgi:GTP-binding protein EngB required for normal cell division